MGVQWTEDQQKVIDTRNRNLLVSAAAGSGKTAVLVERIIQMILDEEHEVDIDQLLVVTFTNAAASEMRERVGEAIEKKLLETPDHNGLHKQLALLQHASITTIHSFCLNLLRNYFHKIDLDPGFRIADETELTLLKTDVLTEVMEKHYEMQSKGFIELLESYSSNRSDEQLEDLILNVYAFAQSYPRPEEWLAQQVHHFQIQEEGHIKESWIQVIVQYIHNICTDLYDQMNYALKVCQRVDGPFMYIETLTNELEILDSIKQEDDFLKLYYHFNNLIFTTLSRKKSEQVDPSLREEVKSIRTEVKKMLESLRDQFFFLPFEDMVKDMKALLPVMTTLVEMVIEFSEVYKLAKRDKNIVDFNDLEHLALELLVQWDQETGEAWPTDIAMEMQNQFVEILIDEYQDSNLVQETILSSVSKIKQGQPNMFMVGDVKQSIYKFRLAKPELFMDKYRHYTLDESPYQRIDLHKNFRSRKEVIESVNFVFYQLMSHQMGDVDYNEETALYEGAMFSTCEAGECGGATELHLIQVHKEIAVEENIDITDRELEAKMIAKRIKDLMRQDKPYMVFDKRMNDYRPIQFRDIVILLRTISGWAEIFTEVLMEEGIPAFSDTSTGYFDTLEVKTIISLLKIIDNPRQDIPLISVLRSPIVGLNAEDLAEIRSAYPNGEYYDALCSYLEEPIRHDLTPALEKFIYQLNIWREKVSYTSIHQLMLEIYEDTHYYDYISVMPGGKQRQANLDMLIEKAIQYESSSYKGLFNFIRFVDRLNKYNIGVGEASILGEDEDLVRIMSIHKSKGLEFPVVFVSGLGKQFNTQDLYQSIIIHPDLGLGPDYVDYEKRFKRPTLIKKAIQKQLELESLSEELRVLYVALTRAKEKLILTGTIPTRTTLEKKIEKWSRACHHPSIRLPYGMVVGASTYLDWIVPSLIRHEAAERLLDKMDRQVTLEQSFFEKDAPFHIEIFTLENMMTKDLIERLEDDWLKEQLLNWDTAYSFDDTLENEINTRLNWEYPFKDEVNVHIKMSVSEIKKYDRVEEEVEIPSMLDFEFEERKPKFMEELSTLTAAEKGTLMHKVMQYIPLEKMGEYQLVEESLRDLVAQGFINEKEKASVYIKDILNFSKTDLAKRMIVADEVGNLYKEKQFVLGMQAYQLDESLKSNEIVLIQGVIDCYFEEEDGLVLVDYKTDYVPEGNEQVLIERYKKQLDYYEKALGQVSGKKVKERIIYSFGLNKSIIC